MRGFWMTLASSIAADTLVTYADASALAASARERGGEYWANKASSRASGRSRRKFIAAWLSSTENAPALMLETARTP
jgi:hypothetical protein